ncbi:hypothetical protein I4U23_028126 [Adineta vaga]|nr:hypothetical protein I4U23_028126 [Adineta vaga]
MANQNVHVDDFNVASSVEETEEMIVSKDEHQLTTTIQENDCASECSFSTRSEEDLTRSILEVEADAFTRFIDRQRVEVMFELRNLRLGDRPVTGQSNRERIETFLNDVQARREQRTPATRPVVPSAHLADINALANRGCVSSALRSTGFRQDLENAIRRSIEPQRELQAWQTITQLQREIIVIEISDLVHRQLVSSALESDFRTHLEHSVLSRLQQGAPTEQTAPTTITPRIQPTPAPHVRPAVRTSTNPSTINELSSRLDDMQHMLKLMYSMQMDMQRTLRQEVASSLANASTTTTMISANHPINAGHCTVCLTAIADTVLYRCGHLCVCYTCGLNLRETTSTTRMKCPICRAPVDDILRVFRSSRDEE